MGLGWRKEQFPGASTFSEVGWEHNTVLNLLFLHFYRKVASTGTNLSSTEKSPE